MRTENLTPTWTGLLPGMLAVVRDGETVEARHAIEGEFRRMARAADSWNEYVRSRYELCAECDHFVVPNDAEGEGIADYIHLTEDEEPEHEAVPSGIRAPLVLFRALRPDLFDVDGAGHIGPNRPSHVMSRRGAVPLT